MFKVYGVTLETAKAAAEKKYKNLPLRERQEMTPESCEKFMAEHTEDQFVKMKPVAIGKSLATPEFAKELIALAKKTTRQRDMHIRIHAPQVDASGAVIINNRTKKVAMSWERYDEHKDYVAAFERAEMARQKHIEEAEAA